MVCPFDSIFQSLVDNVFEVSKVKFPLIKSTCNVLTLFAGIKPLFYRSNLCKISAVIDSTGKPKCKSSLSGKENL